MCRRGRAFGYNVRSASAWMAKMRSTCISQKPSPAMTVTAGAAWSRLHMSGEPLRLRPGRFGLTRRVGMLVREVGVEVGAKDGQIVERDEPEEGFERLRGWGRSHRFPMHTMEWSNIAVLSAEWMTV